MTNPALSSRHFHGLCTTGGIQPFMDLQEHCRDEWRETGEDSTGFLDRPMFYPTGSGFQTLDDRMQPVSLRSIEFAY